MLFKFFKDKWLTEGRAGDLVREKGWDTAYVEGMIEGFKESDVYELIKASMLDYMDKKEADINDLNVCSAHYDRVMAVHWQLRNLPKWFFKFVENLQSFAYSEAGQAKDKSKYI